MPEPRRIIVLGSTGSIGTQTLDVVEHLNRMGLGPIEVVGLAAGRCSAELAQQARRWNARVATADAGTITGARSHAAGPDAAADLIHACHAEGSVDMVVAAIVGIAGLRPTLAAIELGIDVALANKETLVAAGELVVASAHTSGARILPVDSEHSALWQCLAGVSFDHGGSSAPPMPPMACPREVDRMILTASGGALRDWTSERIAEATPEEALAHPTWQMGRKVTIDTATLMNKGFEAMEARWLFDLPPERIGVLIQPTSTVHSLVEFVDGAMLAQLGTPDMRTAIQYAMLRGTHATAPDTNRLDLAAVGTLEFRDPDTARFPMLSLAFDAMRTGGTAGAILNAANEAAVNAFLERDNADGSRLRLGRVPELVAEAIASIPTQPIRSIDTVLEADAAARDIVLAGV